MLCLLPAQLLLWSGLGLAVLVICAVNMLSVRRSHLLPFCQHTVDPLQFVHLRGLLLQHRLQLFNLLTTAAGSQLKLDLFGHNLQLHHL